MATLSTPTNFRVIRSDDRESAIFSWDAPPPVVIPLTFDFVLPQPYIGWAPQFDPHIPGFVPTPPIFDDIMHMWNQSLPAQFTGTSPGTYTATVIATGGHTFTEQMLMRMSKNGVDLGTDVLVNVGQIFTVADGLRGQITGPIDHYTTVKLNPGDAWSIDVVVATSHAVPISNYTIRQSERNNGLGFTTAAVIPHNPLCPRQYAVIDGLDPDQFYSFNMFATDEEANVSGLTRVVTDF